jgi:DNA-directed RNA polymerase specialized sigma24 family protein
MQTSTNTVEVALHRALRRLRDVLERQEPDERSASEEASPAY